MERTLVIIKSDALQRGIVGDIIHRFEKVGLKLVGIKMLAVDSGLADKHYPNDRKEFIKGMGQKTLENMEEQGADPKEYFETDDAQKIGEKINEWNQEYLKSGPVIAMVLEGPHAVEVVRKLVGFTLPQKAAPGTIRGDYSFDSAFLGNVNKRPIRNLIHASGNPEEAKFEVGLWFSEAEMHDYDTVHQQHMNR